jgi:hypothetical protein
MTAQSMGRIPDGATRRGPRLWRRRGEAALARDGDRWNLRFESVGVHIPAALVADSPTLLMVAIEDVCWQVAMQQCRSTRPHRWHRRAYAAWAAQRERLEQKRERLRLLIDEQLLAW